MKLILAILAALLSFSALAQVNFHYQINVTVQCVSVTTDPTTGDLTCVQAPAGTTPTSTPATTGGLTCSLTVEPTPVGGSTTMRLTDACTGGSPSSYTWSNNTGQQNPSGGLWYGDVAYPTVTTTYTALATAGTLSGSASISVTPSGAGTIVGTTVVGTTPVGGTTTTPPPTTTPTTPVNLPVSMTCSITSNLGTVYGTLYATCSPAATGYTWSVPGCSAASASCRITVPTVPTTYTVIGNTLTIMSNTASITLP